MNTWSDWIRNAVGLGLGLGMIMSSVAGVTHYVAMDGDDGAAGGELSPFRTVAKAVGVAGLGDTVVVRVGGYGERVVTVRGGSNEAERIVFRADGVVIVEGFEVKHPYITVDGFDITGHAPSDVYSGYVEVAGGGDYFRLQNSTVRDGVYVARSDVYFHDNGPQMDTITSAGGGFLEAGFRPGAGLMIRRSAPPATGANTGTTFITAVTDDTITVSKSLVDEGPADVYLSGSYAYGLVVRTGAENCVIRGNSFSNLTFDAWFVGGATNLFEGNVISATHGWDAMHFMGSDLTFRGNYIHSSPLVVVQNSPDVFENYNPIPYHRVLFTNNYVQGFAGVLAAQKGTEAISGPLTYSRNVFIDVGLIAIVNPDTTFENNTFLRVAATNTPVTSVRPHPIQFAGIYSPNPVVRNNIFVGCGQGQRPTDDTAVLGWYEFVYGTPANPILTHNFVAGPAPGFGSKVGFDEGIPGLNGGDPGFVDLANPLGPDGLPFTDDDGLRLRDDSKLRGQGTDGGDLGAYDGAVGLPVLLVALGGDGELTISWPTSAADYRLESASSLTGAWGTVSNATVVEGGRVVVTVDSASEAQFFRLRE